METTFKAVVEVSSAFLKLWPHRYDYLYAKHPRPGEAPIWLSETKHPLSDRLIRQGAYLYGVRFGRLTRYALIDIDKGSIYHPGRDPFAVKRMLAALEDVGLVAAVCCTSSYSGGLHVYLPFEELIESWKVAEAIATVLEREGFVIEAGTLEIFPNRRPFTGEEPVLFKGHRLPLQAGSYLLSSEWELQPTSHDRFLQHWRACTLKNDVQPAALDRLLKSTRRKHHRLSHSAAKFLSDLNACIEPGWTSNGQTNYLLGRITLRSYVFGHVLEGGDPLEGDRLVAEVVATATQLPGYGDYCRHQHEIWARAEEWCRSAETSHYWPYRMPKGPRRDQAPGEQPPASNTWNDYQERHARGRIHAAIVDMLNRGRLPAGARDRFIRLTRDYAIGGETAYRHRDLWHPDELGKTPPGPPPIGESVSSDCARGASEREQRTSLLGHRGGNPLVREAYRDFLRSIFEASGGNSAPDKALSDSEPIRGPDSG